MRGQDAVLMAGAFMLLWGCALSEMRAQNQQAQARIDAKIEQLAQEQSTQRALLDQQRTLLGQQEANQRQLTDLDARLDSLIRENAQTEAHNQTQQKQKEAIESQLRKYREQIAALRDNTSVPDAAKEARIEELKKQIDAYLKSIRPL